MSIQPFPSRPWVGHSDFVMLSSDKVLHADASIWLHAAEYYLVIDWRLGGHKLVHSEAWRLDHDAGALELCDHSEAYAGGRVAWKRFNTHIVSRMHKALLRLVAAKPWKAWRSGAYSDVERCSLLCHYIAVTDSDPWPRAWVNWVHVPRDKRPRPKPKRMGRKVLERQREAYLAALQAESRIEGTLPDWL